MTLLKPRERASGDELRTALQSIVLKSATAALAESKANRNMIMFMATIELPHEVETAMLQHVVDRSNAERSLCTAAMRAVMEACPELKLDAPPPAMTMDEQWEFVKHWRARYDEAVKSEAAAVADEGAWPKVDRS